VSERAPIGSPCRGVAPLMLPYRGVAPRVAAPPSQAAAGCALLGRVTLGAGALLGLASVMRGDGHHIVAGADLYLGARATVHIAHDLHPALIGERVTVGPNAVVHACTVGDGCVVGADVAILDAATVGPDTVLTPGSIVFPRTVLPGGCLCSGAPAKPVRALEPGELARWRARLRSAAATADPHGSLPRGARPAASAIGGFVAATARLAGDVRLAPEASVWFGCTLDARAHPVAIAAGANVQDNSAVRALRAPVTIGADTTIGHNVELHDCRIGARALIGMSSRLAGGTVVQDDVFLAAGATTEPGQVLHGGWLWGGRPARALAPLDDARRAAVMLAATIYRDYAAAFAGAQAEAKKSP